MCLLPASHTVDMDLSFPYLKPQETCLLFDTVDAHLLHVDFFCGSFRLSCMPDFPFGMISVWPENTVPLCLDVGLLVMNWFCSSDSILIFCLHP